MADLLDSFGEEIADLEQFQDLEDLSTSKKRDRSLESPMQSRPSSTNGENEEEKER